MADIKITQKPIAESVSANDQVLLIQDDEGVPVLRRAVLGDLDVIEVDDTLTQSRKAADAKKVGDELTGLKGDFNNFIDGKQNIGTLANFQNGGLSNISAPYIDGKKYRVSTTDIITFEEATTITVKSGFKFVPLLYSDGVYSDGGWKTGTYSISGGTQLILSIARTTENTSEIADISEFVNAITFPTRLQSSIDDTNNELSKINNNTDLIGTKVDYISDVTKLSENTLEWEKGTITYPTGMNNNHGNCIRTTFVFLEAGSVIALSDYTGVGMRICGYSTPVKHSDGSNVVFFNITSAENTWGTTDYITPKDAYVIISFHTGATVTDASESAAALSGKFNFSLIESSSRTNQQQEINVLNNVSFYEDKLSPIFISGNIVVDSINKTVTFPSTARLIHRSPNYSARDWNIGDKIVNYSNATVAQNVFLRLTDNTLQTVNYYAIVDGDGNALRNDEFALVCIITLDGKLTINAPLKEDEDAGAKHSAVSHVGQFFADKLPEYWIKDDTEMTHYLEGKIKRINDLNLPTVLFYTDSHYRSNAKHSFDIMGLIKERCNIEHVIFGGDLLGQETSTELGEYMMTDYMKDVLNRFGSSHKFVFGNHDLNVANSTADNYQSRTLTYEYVYKQCVAPFVDSVVFEEAVEESGTEAWYRDRMHYYFDDTKNKLRFIIVDTGTINDTVVSSNGYLEVGTPGRLRYQLPWLANVIQNTPNGYSILVIGHEWYTAAAETPTMADVPSRMMRLLSAAKNKTSVTINIEHYRPDKSQDGYTSHTFDFTNLGNVNIIGALCGHIHMDFYELKEGIPSIVVNNDAYAAATVYSPTMTVGTVTEQTVEAISIDTANRMVYLTRIGAGSNRSFAF